LKKNKGVLTLDDWIVAVTSWGIPPETIEKLSGTNQPGNLYYEIAYRQDKVAVAADVVLYDTTHLPETENLYYEDHHMYEFSANIIDVFANVKEENKTNIVILDRSALYPTSGG
jgi:alanyl-tRNA synthetase